VSLLEEGAGRGSLVGVDRRLDLHHFAASLHGEAQCLRGLDDALDRAGRLVVLDLSVVERGSYARLGLDAPGPVCGRDQALEPRRVLRDARMALEAVDADVLDAVEADHPSRVGRGPAADAGDERISVRQALDLLPRLQRHGGVLGPFDDRRERPVDVEEHGRLLRLAPESHQADRGAHWARP
jgi:hypothetical protein